MTRLDAAQLRALARRTAIAWVTASLEPSAAETIGLLAAGLNDEVADDQTEAFRAETVRATGEIISTLLAVLADQTGQTPAVLWAAIAPTLYID